MCVLSVLFDMIVFLVTAFHMTIVTSRVRYARNGTNSCTNFHTESRF